jgi:GNAT superfamily N-acetyltransferase
MSTEDYTVRKATPSDLDAIKALADTQRQELGFVLRPALARSIERGEVFVAENSTGLVGFIEYHHRQDRQTTVYHVAVISGYRRKGVGRALIETLRDEALDRKKCTIRLKCPAHLPAQGFYARLGFNSLGREGGGERHLVVWALTLDTPDTT